MAVSVDLFKRGMRMLGGGVTIVTTLHEDTPAGLTATAVCSVSAEPQRVLACINRAGATYGAISLSRRFCVNVLAGGHHELATCFAGMMKADDRDRFEHGNWTTIATGSPVLEDALSAFDCTVSSIVDTGSHAIIIGDILAIRVGAGSGPLIYMDGQFSTLAPLCCSEQSGAEADPGIEQQKRRKLI